MFIGNLDDIVKHEMKAPGACGAFKQVVIGPNEGWDGYVMRVMTLETGGHSPKHSHGWPHINYVISGKGNLMMDGVDYPVTTGFCAFIPADMPHEFRNTGDDELKFICIVPEIGEF